MLGPFAAYRTARLTIAGSICVAVAALGCASTRDGAPLPALSVHAPAEVAEPFIPRGEPVVAESATALTLDDALVYADAHAPAIAVARARVGLADAAQVEADLTFPANPALRLAGGGRTVGGDTGFDFEVAIEQQLEIAGEQALRRAAAHEGRRLAEATVNAVRWSVHVETHRLVLDLQLARERVAQAEKFVAFAEKMRAIAARQIEAGESSPLIALVADADLARTRETVIAARQVQAALGARLAAVIGWPTATLPLLEATLPPVRTPPAVEVLLERMAAHHPALRVRELAVAARRREAALAERAGWPQPTLGVSYGREAAPGPEEGAQIWLLHLSVPVPLWRTGEAERAEARAQATVADRARDAEVARLRGELRQATIALRAAAERVELYATGVVPQVEEHLALLQRAYDLGEVDLHQVSQTRERLLDATGQAIDARVHYYETAAALEGLVGTELWVHAAPAEGEP
ncbi:MAG: TolC family protein [Myxococcales bacterium]|nr:TolC family protein [Myxococcales bacterium]